MYMYSLQTKIIAFHNKSRKNKERLISYLSTSNILLQLFYYFFFAKKRTKNIFAQVLEKKRTETRKEILYYYK